MSSSGVKAKVYPSSSGFMEGRTVYTDYDSGCLRSIGYKALGVQVPFDAKTAQVGADNETVYEAQLTNQGTSYEREKAISVDLGGGVILSGRIDFVTDHSVIELKSTRSASKRTKLRAGNPTTENVAQLVAYMVATERVTGQLCYTFYNEKKNTKENYDFTVNIEADGSIKLNGETYRYDLYSYLTHRNNSVRVISDLISGNANAISSTSRPFRADGKFDSPCNFCPFRLACDSLERSVDNGGVIELEELKQLAQESVNVIKGVK